MTTNSQQYLQPGNQTVISQITSKASQLVQNIASTATSDVNSISSTLSADLAQADAALNGIAKSLTGELDTLVSGASQFFGLSSPKRVSKNALANRNKNTANKSPSIKIPTSKRSVSPIPLQFPSDLGIYQMVLNFYKYERETPLADTKAHSVASIALPLPDGRGLQDNTAQNWNSTSLGVAGNLSRDVLMDKMSAGDLMKKMEASGSAALTYAALATHALGSLESTLSVQAGIIANPALAMLYTGPSFRSYSLSWMFSPRNQKETEDLRNILNLIKQFHLPSTVSNGGAAASWLFNYPHMVKPVFLPSALNKSMYQFKYAVIKDVDIEYSPGNSIPSFYGKSQSPVFISLRMTLEEIELVLPEDYGAATNSDYSSSLGAVNSGVRTVINDAKAVGTNLASSVKGLF